MGVGLYLLFLAVSFGASVVGAICGIGGGVLIKPVLDAVSGLSVTAVSFLSACTVLSMTSCSMLRAFKKGDTLINRSVSTPLAIGAALGGIAGKEIFRVLLSRLPNSERVGAVQSCCLFFVMLGLMLYTVKRDRIRTYHLTNPFSCLLAGGALGLMSSFLGIGGGPIDLIVLFFFIFHGYESRSAEFPVHHLFFSSRQPALHLLDGVGPRYRGRYAAFDDCRRDWRRYGRPGAEPENGRGSGEQAFSGADGRYYGNMRLQLLSVSLGLIFNAPV